jgi:hypothetical protein
MSIFKLSKRARRWKVLASLIRRPVSHVGVGRRKCRKYKRGGSRLKSVGQFMYKHRNKIAAGAAMATALGMRDVNKSRGIVNAMSNYV